MALAAALTVFWPAVGIACWPLLGMMIPCCCDTFCNECCTAIPAPLTLSVDLGIGGWTGGCVNICNLLTGEYLIPFSPFIQECDWRLIDQTSACGGLDQTVVRAAIIHDGGECYWRVTVAANDGVSGGSSAIYESARWTGSGSCTLPQTLTKVSESGSYCSGSLPATITVDLP